MSELGLAKETVRNEPEVSFQHVGLVVVLPAPLGPRKPKTSPGRDPPHPHAGSVLREEAGVMSASWRIQPCQSLRHRPVAPRVGGHAVTAEHGQFEEDVVELHRDITASGSQQLQHRLRLRPAVPPLQAAPPSLPTSSDALPAQSQT